MNIAHLLVKYTTDLNCPQIDFQSQLHGRINDFYCGNIQEWFLLYSYF
jgi:hypothetical protein